jgi:hypothetical protein
MVKVKWGQIEERANEPCQTQSFSKDPNVLFKGSIAVRGIKERKGII